MERFPIDAAGGSIIIASGIHYMNKEGLRRTSRTLRAPIGPVWNRLQRPRLPNAPIDASRDRAVRNIDIGMTSAVDDARSAYVRDLVRHPALTAVDMAMEHNRGRYPLEQLVEAGEPVMRVILEVPEATRRDMRDQKVDAACGVGEHREA